MSWQPSYHEVLHLVEQRSPEEQAQIDLLKFGNDLKGLACGRIGLTSWKTPNSTSYAFVRKRPKKRTVS